MEMQSLIAAGANVDTVDDNGVSPLDLAAPHSACRNLLEHHAAVLETLAKKTGELVSAAFAHCANLSASNEPVPEAALSPHEYQLNPSFFWASPDARAAVFTWAYAAYITQLATTTRPFLELPDDCAGDVLDYFVVEMARSDSFCIATHCSSPEAHAWVAAVVTAAVAVRVKAIRHRNF